MERGGGKISKPLNSKEVHMYDKNGKYIQSFLSLSDASRFIYGHPRFAGNISRACLTGCFCKQYQMSKVKYPFMKDYETYKKGKYSKMIKTISEKYTDNPVTQFTKARKVGQYTLDGELVKVWDSQT